MPNKIEPKCKNCRLFDPQKEICRVVILFEGERRNLPVDAEDNCFYEQEFMVINEKGQKETFKPDVQQVKWWVEDPVTGKKTDKGIVKIEYPHDFFGPEDIKNEH